MKYNYYEAVLEDVREALKETDVRDYEELYDQEVKEGKGSFKQIDREKNIVNLMRVNILKRLESSINSFSLTLERILNQINNMFLLNHATTYHKYKIFIF